MRLKVDCSLHYIFRANHPANAPTRHCIRLCNTVNDDAGFGKFRDKRWHRRKLVLAIGEMLVDLVGNHPDAVLNCPLANCDGLFWRVHSATWVVW